jgi:hypothetical protein
MSKAHKSQFFEYFLRENEGKQFFLKGDYDNLSFLAFFESRFATFKKRLKTFSFHSYFLRAKLSKN